MCEHGDRAVGELLGLRVGRQHELAPVELRLGLDHLDHVRRDVLLEVADRVGLQALGAAEDEADALHEEEEGADEADVLAEPADGAAPRPLAARPAVGAAQADAHREEELLALGGHAVLGGHVVDVAAGVALALAGAEAVDRARAGVADRHVADGVDAAQELLLRQETRVVLVAELEQPLRVVVREVARARRVEHRHEDRRLRRVEHAVVVRVGEVPPRRDGVVHGDGDGERVEEGEHDCFVGLRRRDSKL